MIDTSSWQLSPKLTAVLMDADNGNGLPLCLELTTGEAHDNRLVTKLLSDLKIGGYVSLIVDMRRLIRAFAGEHGAWANIHRSEIAKSQFASAHISTDIVIRSISYLDLDLFF